MAVTNSPEAHDSDRKRGSGFATATATAVEELLAARIAGRGDDALRHRAALMTEVENGHCGMDPVVIDTLMAKSARILCPAPVPAERHGSGIGDVVIDPAGAAVAVEVKAQTKKASVHDLTQADWIRDHCHTLRWINRQSRDFRHHAGGTISTEIGQPSPDFAAMNLEDVWLLDVAGITDEALARTLGLVTAPDIRAFVEAKRVVLLTREGARVGSLGNVSPVRSILDGHSLTYELNANNRSSVLAIPVRVEGAARAAFTFHLYEGTKGFYGRHKLHGPGAEGLPLVPHP